MKAVDRGEIKYLLCRSTSIDIFRNKCYDVTQTRLAQKTNVDRR